jgi:D-alanyl-D-alanine endopeptidase (penicillin-binding protein 7)
MIKSSALMTILLSLSLGLCAAPGIAETVQTAQTSKAHKVIAVKKHKRHKSSARKHAEASQDSSELKLHSAAAMVLDQSTGAVLFEKNAGAVLPIASISKLMTAMVALDAQPNMDETLSIEDADVDTLKGTHSRLKVGTQLSREGMLRLALMSSENRAAASLSRNYTGGRPAFIAAMNQKAQSLGLQDTHFSDPTGLTAANVSSAHDLVKMVSAAQQYPLIRQFTTTTEYEVALGGRPQTFRNTNSLVKNASWDIGLSKTGFINEAGRCLVMQAWLNNKPTIIVLLDSLGKMTRLGDANRIKQWVENSAVAQRLAAG